MKHPNQYTIAQAQSNHHRNHFDTRGKGKMRCFTGCSCIMSSLCHEEVSVCRTCSE